MSEEEKLPQQEGADSAAEEQETEQTQPAEKEEETPQEEQKEEPKDYSKVTEVEEATTILKEKGFNYDELQKEFDEKGELSEDTFKKLEAVGIPKEVALNYIEGRKVMVERTWDDISSVVGGREKMNSICEWARANLSEAEKQSIDAVTDPNLIKIILKDLNNRMNEKEGIIPQQITGDGGDESGNYFKSMAEVEDAINDPKYAKNEVYRNEVARKISASREAGFLEIK